MSIFARQHPDVVGKPLDDFHWSLIQTQTTSAVVEILKTFFDQNSSYFDIVVPWVTPLKNSTDTEKLFITKVFPFTTRKFPMIAVIIQGHSEKPTFVGADNLMYIDKYIGPDGLMYGEEVFGGMDNLQLSLIIAATDSETRRKLVDAIRICFTHFFKTTFIYQDDDKSFFSISPNMEPFKVGSEKEIVQEGELWIIYATDVSLSVLVEYRFKDYSKRFVQLTNVELDGSVDLS